MVTFVRNCLVKNDFEAVLAFFCCCDYDVNASEAVQKIAKRLSQMLLACYSLLNSQNISTNNSEKRLVTSPPPA